MYTLRGCVAFEMLELASSAVSTAAGLLALGVNFALPLASLECSVLAGEEGLREIVRSLGTRVTPLGLLEALETVRSPILVTLLLAVLSFAACDASIAATLPFVGGAVFLVAGVEAALVCGAAELELDEAGWLLVRVFLLPDCKVDARI